MEEEKEATYLGSPVCERAGSTPDGGCSRCRCRCKCVQIVRKIVVSINAKRSSCGGVFEESIEDSWIVLLCKALQKDWLGVVGRGQ